MRHLPCLWVGVLIWFGLSCYGLFLRPINIMPNIDHLDKVAHFGMFFGQFYLLGYLLNIDSKTKALSLGCVALCWAVVSELIQGCFTTRTMDVWDGVADMAGATVAIFWIFKNKKGQNAPF